MKIPSIRNNLSLKRQMSVAEVEAEAMVVKAEDQVSTTRSINNLKISIGE